MKFIDSHAHIYLPEYDEDRLLVVKRAIEGGIDKILLPNVDKSSIVPMLDLCKAFPVNCYPMMGLHPTSVKEDYQEHLQAVVQYLKSHTFVAIGEIGMDLYWDKTYLSGQREVFAFQVGLARKYSLPLVIHSRDAYAETMSILKQEFNGVPYSGVFHSFSGNVEQAKEVIALGLKIGINGVVTFKNSHLGEVVREVPMEHILLETDAPYLTPVPMRGKRNEPGYILNIAEKIAEIKQISIETIAQVTTQTARTIFKLS
jgi:TatD DNase family protein